MLVGEPFKEIGAQPSGGGAGQQNLEVSQVISIFCMSFTSSSGKWFTRKPQSWGPLGKNAGRSAPKGPGSGSSPEPPWLLRHENFTPLILGRLLNVLEEDAAAGLVLHLQEMLGDFAFLLSDLTEVAHPLQSHIVEVEREAQREVGDGGPQTQVDQVVNGSLHLGAVTDESRNSYLTSNEEGSSEYSVGWSRR